MVFKISRVKSTVCAGLNVDDLFRMVFDCLWAFTARSVILQNVNAPLFVNIFECDLKYLTIARVVCYSFNVSGFRFFLCH